MCWQRCGRGGRDPGALWPMPYGIWPMAYALWPMVYALPGDDVDGEADILEPRLIAWQQDLQVDRRRRAQHLDHHGRGLAGARRAAGTQTSVYRHVCGHVRGHVCRHACTHALRCRGQLGTALMPDCSNGPKLGSHARLF